MNSAGDSGEPSPEAQPHTTTELLADQLREAREEISELRVALAAERREHGHLAQFLTRHLDEHYRLSQQLTESRSEAAESAEPLCAGVCNVQKSEGGGDL